MSYNIIKFPTQLSKIKDASAFRNYCLNPKGLQIQATSNFYKPRVIDSFVNHKLVIHRGEKPLDQNTFVAKVAPSLTKPEIKQFLQKVYNLDVKRINTVNYMGEIRRGPFGNRYRRADFKKAYISLNTPVDEIWQKVQRPE